MKTHKGSCHCGAVTYEVSADFTEAIKCNCSHCGRKGFLLAFVPAEQFSLLSGEDTLTNYQFNQKAIDHLFCKVCGVESFARSAMSDEPMIAINLNCIEDFDISSITINEVDGKHF